jgi:hypothetical protein
MSDGKMVMTEQYTPTINKTELAPGVFVYKDVVPSYEQIIPYVEMVVGANMAWWDNKEIGGNSVETMEFDYPTEFKDPNDPAILFHERLSLVLGGYLGFIENDFVTSNEITVKLAHDKMVLMKYGTDAEFALSENQDGGQVAAMYYLNDDYQGGSIHFPELGVTYEPKANEALVFPSASGFEYTIEKMTDGVKYSILSYLV